MTNETERGDKTGSRLPKGELVELALRMMKDAVPEIERRVMERDAITAAARFKPPTRMDVRPRQFD